MSRTRPPQRPRGVLIVLAVTIVGATTGASAAPVVKRVHPIGLNPGAANRITVVGSGLTEITGLLTTTSATSVLAEGIDKNGQLGDRVVFDCTLPAEATPGLQALRVAGADGVSGLSLFLIDDLPTVEVAGDNKAFAGAQPVTFPAGIDGVLGNLERRFFRFDAAAGQRVAIEVVARRLGSTLDPLVVLYSGDGREIASADDVVGLGGDCQLVHQCEAAGAYVVELRDIRYRGGEDYPFRLRIGDFPCVQTPYPLAVQRGVATSVEFAGIDVSEFAPQPITIPADWPHEWFPVSVQRSSGHASGFAHVLVSDRVEFLEQEPNESSDTANVVATAMNLNGRVQTPGDVDRFKLTAEKGARFVFTGLTRLEGAPTDLQLRVLSLDGKQLAIADDDGVNEGRLDHTFAEAGDYLLEVSDLLRRGGPEFAYRVEVQPHRADFLLEVQADALNVPAGGTVVIPVQATRRGYNGNIDLSLEGLPAGTTVQASTIGTGQSQGFLTATIPAEGAQLAPTAIRVIGTAAVGNETQRVVAEASTWQRGRWANLAVVPSPARSDVVASLAKPEQMTLTVEPAEVVFGKNLKTNVTVKVQRGMGLDAEVQLATNPAKDALPKEIALAVKPIPKGADSVALEFSATGKAPLGAFSVVLTGTLKQDKTTVTVTTPVINYKLAAPLTLAIEPATGPLKIGGSLAAKVRIARNPAFAGAVQLKAEGLPAGITLAEATIAADASEADITLQAAGDAAAGKFAGAKLTAIAADNAALTAELALPEITIE